MTSESVADPGGYLRLAPALAQFTVDKRAAEALAEEEGKKLHAALVRLRRGARSLAERQALDSLLGMRRLFLHYSGTPHLFTINTFGTDLFRWAEPDPVDGTYIATHCVTALFLPLFPLSQWLVRRNEDRSYQIFGRVPASPTMRRWQQGILGAVVAALLFTWVAVDRAGRFQVVHFANGLEVPYAATRATGHGVGDTAADGGEVAGPREGIAISRERRSSQGSPVASLRMWTVRPRPGSQSRATSQQTIRRTSRFILNSMGICRTKHPL